MRPLANHAWLTIWYVGTQIVRETDGRGAGGSEVERAIRELLGPGFSDQLFQLLDPEGRSRFRSGQPPAAAVPRKVRGRPRGKTLEPGGP